jgi:hypothetical protein
VPDADDWWLAKLERTRRRGEQRCQCGHARRQPGISRGAGLDVCMAPLPGQRVCPCTLCRLVRGHHLGDA